ncbi:MAG: GH92 family glycosyl hydrolase [Polyangiaceae bacterium]
MTTRGALSFRACVLGALALPCLRCASTEGSPPAPEVVGVDENDIVCDPFEGDVDDSNAPATPTKEPLVQWVKPSIGTGGIAFGTGSTYPGPQVPFGLAKPSPDTMKGGQAIEFSHCAGYAYEDDIIAGFSQTRLNGAGIADYGHLALMPTIGMSAAKTAASGYASKFRHEAEKASPGYYAVHLDDPNVDVELTASARVAHHRYRFPKTTDATVLFDAAHVIANSVSVSGGKVTYDEGTKRVRGYAHVQGSYSARSGGVRLYFVATLSRAPTSFGTWKNGVLEASGKSAEDTAVGAYFGFDTTTDPTVEVSVGLSFVDEEHAAANLEREAKTFDAARAEAEAAWEVRLSRVRIDARNDRDRTIFYTALYHAGLMPTLATDVDGSYRGIDGQVRAANGFTYYTDFSLWDTYRNFHSLVSLVYPEDATNFAASLVQMGKDSGYLPRWPLGTGETRGMIGDGATIVLADTFVKGIQGWDARAGYDIAKKQATEAPPGDARGGRDRLSDWLSLGFISSDSGNASVSMSLEYAAADHALSAYAAALGESKDAALFRSRGKGWEKLYDPKSHFFFPRKSNGTMEPVNPTYMGGAYTEGTPWHYNFMVPHDIDGLVTKMTRPVFLGKLEQFFTRAICTGKVSYLPNAYYWPSNEPQLFSSWAFAVAGDRVRAGRYLRYVTTKNFGDGPDGLPGNDDGGTMSAFYIFSALGFYPIAGTDAYVLGSPLFPKATLTTPRGTVSVVAPKASKLTMTPSATTQNGAVIGPMVRHDRLFGGPLVFDMRAEK